MVRRVTRPGRANIYTLTMPDEWSNLSQSSTHHSERVDPNEVPPPDPNEVPPPDPNEVPRRLSTEGYPLKVIQSIGQKPKSDHEDAIERIYSAYPKKVGKGQAVRAIRSAMKSTPFEILAYAVKAYADAVSRWPDSEKQYIPNPSTWFNGRRWEDDPSTWVRSQYGSAKTQPQYKQQQRTGLPIC
jgi:hypothetical protein